MTGAGVLVAGIGNIFFRDDGFGPAVAAALLAAARQRPLPAGVRVVDYGIRGMHLSFDLLGDVTALVIVDAVPPGTATVAADAMPGTVLTLEIGPQDLGEGDFDAHGMSPVAVLASLRPMGATLPTTYLVGCVPADVSEGIGLSAPVTDSVDRAVDAVFDVLASLDIADPAPQRTGS